MTDEKSSESRRKLLKSIAAGSSAIIAGKSLPDSWSKPVVDSVMLPAHAQTSLGPFGGMAVRRVSELTDDADSMLSKAIESLVPEAAAQPITSTAYLCVTPSADLQSADVELILVANEECFSQYFTVTGVPVGGSKVFTTREGGCEYLQPVGLIEELGIINMAHAGTSSSQVEVFLDSVTGGAIGRVMISGSPFTGEIHDFDLIDPCFDLKTKHCCETD